jgi:hypothetical protein
MEWKNDSAAAPAAALKEDVRTDVPSSVHEVVFDCSKAYPDQPASLMNRTLLIPVLIVAGLSAGCHTADTQKHSPSPSAARFSHPTEITNPFLPLAALKQDVLEGKEGKKNVRIERTRMPQTKTFQIDGQAVEAMVVEDREYENGALTEATLDYFAQADDGTVYYLGEDVDEYRNGKVVGHSGAWLYGKDTRNPGVMMPANPKIGDKFRSEDVPKITWEADEVIALYETVTVPAGVFSNCLKIKEVLSDGAIEYKYYAPGVGCVKEIPEEGEVLLKSHAISAIAEK